jgi:hypothetical protein
MALAVVALAANAGASPGRASSCAAPSVNVIVLARSIGPIKLGEMRATAQAKAGHEKHIVAKGDTHYYPRLELFIGYKNGRVAVISDSSNAATASGDPLAGTQYGTAHSCLGLGSGYPHFTAIYPHAACASGLYGGEPGQPDKYKNTVCTVDGRHGNFTVFSFAGLKAGTLHCAAIDVAVKSERSLATPL